MGSYSYSFNFTREPRTICFNFFDFKTLFCLLFVSCIQPTKERERMEKKEEKVVVGVPVPVYYGGENEYQRGIIPPNAVFGDPKGIPIQQTIYRDTPAPFNCPYCAHTALTTVRSKPSLAAFVGCLMPMMLGVCFLCPSMDCLWHKYHYCPKCQEKVADFEKSDPCVVMDPPHWTQESFALSG